ncbi:hypothetical protein STRATTON_29 [Erwinia phage vB_EamM_Stratton]|uniref:Uncharacterized protein n=1 Tax=Erwinia phage vB_EamM_Stratton TaxID=1883378 RepID=A0A1B2IGU5_9CAUD|nr:hypothetical protein STRATTON_29 [Erwinia phage vB_EamM_Stratton]
MRIMFDVPNEVNRYGAMKFFETVRDNVLHAIEAGNLEIAESNIRQFYQDYAWAYIIATKNRNPAMLDKYLMQVTCDPIGDWTPMTDASGAEIQLGALASDKPLPDHMLIIDDQFASGEDETYTFLCAEDSNTLSHFAALEAAKERLTHELTTRTGLAALIESMLPGDFSSYVGESFDGMVVICHETLLGRGGNI